MSETPYMETEALIAIMEDNPDRAEEIVSEMMPMEAKRLSKHAWDLSALASRHYRESR